MTLACEGRDPQELRAGDRRSLPEGLRNRLAACSPGLQVLEVSLPAAKAR
jgi:hypothetical protein